MIPFCGYYICWYANLWDISFTKDVDWDQLLLCIEPHSCLIQQILLDNSSLMYNLHKGFIWIQLKALSRKINNRQIHPSICFTFNLLSHPSSFGSFCSSIYFLRKQHHTHQSLTLRPVGSPMRPAFTQWRLNFHAWSPTWPPR